eukprot:IDg21265t1
MLNGDQHSAKESGTQTKGVKTVYDFESDAGEVLKVAEALSAAYMSTWRYSYTARRHRMPYLATHRIFY